jgi:hypothetical protein
MDKRKLAVVVSGLVPIGGLSAGAALAQSSGSAPPSSQATSPGTDGIEQAESKEGVDRETKGAEEPGDEKLPGGGHADPEGQNVDHQFEGAE